jgi:hypothetical protein
MTWTDLRKSLKNLPADELLTLLKGLHDLSPQNKAWLQNQLSPMPSAEYLEECRKKVVNLVYNPARKMPDMPRFRDAKKVISEYKKSAKDTAGTLDLMLTYVERGHAFTNDFGDIDEPFYDALCNMLGKFSEELQAHPAGPALYHDRFASRLLAIGRTADIGWGYGDCVRETLGELAAFFL